MSEYRVVTDGHNFRIEERFLLFWNLFLYGVNEGGGRYYIEEDSKEKALEKLQEVLKQNAKKTWKPV